MASADAGGGVEALWLLGADGFDAARIGAGTFVVYQGHHGEAGAGAGRRDPAGRGLYREGRHLRQHRGPGAARPPRRLSAGRGAGGLEDHPRRFSELLGARLPYDTLDGGAGAAGRGEPGLRRRRRSPPHGCTDQAGPAGDAAAVADAAFTPAVANYWQADVDQPRLRHHGGMRADLSLRRRRRSRRDGRLFSPRRIGILAITVAQTLALLVPLLIAVAYLT